MCIHTHTETHTILTIYISQARYDWIVCHDFSHFIIQVYFLLNDRKILLK